MNSASSWVPFGGSSPTLGAGSPESGWKAPVQAEGLPTCKGPRRTIWGRSGSRAPFDSLRLVLCSGAAPGIPARNGTGVRDMVLGPCSPANRQRPTWDLPTSLGHGTGAVAGKLASSSRILSWRLVLTFKAKHHIPLRHLMPHPQGLCEAFPGQWQGLGGAAQLLRRASTWPARSVQAHSTFCRIFGSTYS